jgi:hypothetical protein
MLPARHQISSDSFHQFNHLIEVRNREFEVLVPRIPRVLPGTILAPRGRHESEAGLGPGGCLDLPKGFPIKTDGNEQGPARRYVDVVQGCRLDEGSADTPGSRLGPRSLNVGIDKTCLLVVL